MHFRAQPDGLPAWLSRFVATGYASYATRLPTAFADRGTSPQALGGMLAFIFTLESLALAMGCARSQLVIALEQARGETADPEKLGLLWAAEWLVQLRDEAGLIAAFSTVLDHPLGRRAYPRYLSGFLRALTFASRAAPLAVTLIGRALVSLPDHVLLPWIPGLLTTLQDQSSDVLPMLMAELMRHLSTRGLTAWSPPWLTAPTPPIVDTPPADAPTSDAPTSDAPALTAREHAAWSLLAKHRAPLEAWAALTETRGAWTEAKTAPSAPTREPVGRGASELVRDHPAAALAWATLVAR